MHHISDDIHIDNFNDIIGFVALAVIVIVIITIINEIISIVMIKLYYFRMSSIAEDRAYHL